MQQIYLGADDLTRTYIHARRSIWIEAVFSVHALRYRGADALFAAWSSQVGRRVGSIVGDLVDLWPSGPGIHRQTALTVGPHTEEIRALGLAPGWWEVANDGRAEVVIAALRQYKRLAVEPYWDAVHAVLEAARARLVRISGEAGVHALLGSLHPTIRWRPPWLEVGDAAVGGNGDDEQGDRKVHLDGHGLEIVPSFFCPPGYPIVALAGVEGASDLLLVPAAHGLRLDDVVIAHGAAPRALGGLLGQTRASVLHVVGDGACTTSELARRLGISISAASQHARVLREAGLVRSERCRSAVLHTLTPLGARLAGRSF